MDNGHITGAILDEVTRIRQSLEVLELLQHERPEVQAMEDTNDALYRMLMRRYGALSELVFDETPTTEA